MDVIGAIILILVLIIATVYIYYKNAFKYWRLRGIPHEKPTFPFGNVKGFGIHFHQSIVTKRIYDKFKGTAKFCGVYILAGRVALILDLDLLKHILVKDFANFSDKGLYTNGIDEPLMDNLFFIDGEKWKKLRNKLTPTFTSGKMKFMFPTVVEVGERFKDCLTETIQQNDIIEVKDILARFTCDVIGTCAFGIECNSLKDPNAEFKRMGQKAFIPKYPSAISMAIHGWKDLARKLHVKVLKDEISKFFLNVVQETVEYREKNNIRRNYFLDILINLKNNKTNDESVDGLTLNELAAQVFLFFLAGFETSSSTLMFCLYELARHPEIQSQSRNVVRDAYKKHGTLTYEMMLDMPFIDHILQETLRLYPPISVSNRVAKNDYRVPGTNDIIEKGTIVLISMFAIQRDPEYYPNPDQFDPHRYDSEEMKHRDAMAWLPFGEGPRNCIGMRFGMMQSRIGLIILLNNFEFSLSSKTSNPLKFIPHSFILAPEGGVYLKLNKINSDC